MAGIGSTLKRAIFWDYRRGSWQYDVIVVGILAFIFLTHRELFRDQPRIPNASAISVLPGAGHGAFIVDREMVESVPEDQRLNHLAQEISKRNGRVVSITRIQPIFDERESELKGYVAFPAQ